MNVSLISTHGHYRELVAVTPNNRPVPERDYLPKLARMAEGELTLEESRLKGLVSEFHQRELKGVQEIALLKEKADALGSLPAKSLISPELAETRSKTNELEVSARVDNLGAAKCTACLVAVAFERKLRVRECQTFDPDFVRGLRHNSDSELNRLSKTSTPAQHTYILRERERRTLATALYVSNNLALREAMSIAEAEKDRERSHPNAETGTRLPPTDRLIILNYEICLRSGEAPTA